MDYSTNSVVLNTASHESEGHPILLPNGSLLLVYRIDADASGTHVGNPASLACRTSANGGTTWGDEVTVYSSEYDDRNHAVGVLASGRIVVLLRRYNATTSTTVDNGYVYSDDNGATWSTYTTLTMESVTIHFGPIRKAPDGRYYVVAYTTGRVEVWFSADGMTWGERNAISTDAGVTESVAVFISQTDMVCVSRHENYTSAGYYFYSSADTGKTWSARTQITRFSAYWMSAPWVTYDTSTDRVYVFGGERRDYASGVHGAGAPNSLLLVYSADATTALADPNGAATWTLEHSFLRPMPSAYFFYGYPAVADSHNGVSLCVFSEAEADTNEDAELYSFAITGADFSDLDGYDLDVFFLADYDLDGYDLDVFFLADAPPVTPTDWMTVVPGDASWASGAISTASWSSVVGGISTWTTAVPKTPLGNPRT